MTGTICLNADIGEMPGEEGRALDRAILKHVSRCSIACGGHAGDAVSMAQTLKLASAAGVLAGAHPSYPDREGFGRSRHDLSLAGLRASLRSQIDHLLGIARTCGVTVSHIKPHGALYNDAARDTDLAHMVAQLCQDIGILTLIGPPASEMQRAAAGSGLRYLAEGFADRAYEPDGSLTPRTQPGAVFSDPKRQLDQVLAMVLRRSVTARTGERIALEVDTICLHGDTPGAAENAGRLRSALEQQGIAILA